MSKTFSFFNFLKKTSFVPMNEHVTAATKVCHNEHNQTSANFQKTLYKNHSKHLLLLSFEC